MEMQEREPLTSAEIWQKYQRGVEWHQKKSIFTRADRCHRFYEGDQWSDSEGSIGTDLPTYNFLAPTVDYKTAMIAQNSMTINYSPSAAGSQEELAACRGMNAFARKTWEKQKMDTVLWEAVKEACIAGDAFLYFYDDRLRCQLLGTDKVFLGDEQQADVQKQPYIIVYERRLVDDVREDARKNGLDELEVMDIVSDSEQQQTARYKDEVKGRDSEKCSCLLYMTLRGGALEFCRSTRTVVYQPEQRVDGLNRYPVAQYTWKRQSGMARGNGEIWWMIPNQIELNKNLLRRLESIKCTAFPKPVYVDGLVANPENLSTVGTPVKVKDGGTVQRVQDVFTYLQPAGISGDAKAMQDELLENTRNLANAGDSVMGNINPEQASGTAIVAVKDAQAVPLNQQKDAARQFAEDIALIWYDMTRVYSTEGLKTDDGLVTPEELEATEPEVRVDVSDGNPYSRYARDQALQAALTAGYITFEEFVQSLDEDSAAPKQKFAEILKQRKAQQTEAAGQEGPGDGEQTAGEEQGAEVQNGML